jgi:hypothetical protein
MTRSLGDIMHQINLTGFDSVSFSLGSYKQAELHSLIEFYASNL